MKSTRSPILVIDDEPAILLAVDTILQMVGLGPVATCQDSRLALTRVSELSPCLVLLDLTMPHVDGRQVLEALKTDFPDIPVVVITGAVDAGTAVACMKTGAFDYLVKPVDEARLVTTVKRALAFSELSSENRRLKEDLHGRTAPRPSAFHAIITRDGKMEAIFRYIESIAPTRRPVLIRGETGVGKELIARAVHDLSGLKGPFVPVNVAGVDDNVFSDTLFGHLRGAFTGADAHRPGLIEQASGGTLFLDEIGDLSLASQVKLLRLLETGEYLPLGADTPRVAQVRIVASTNVELWERLASGQFRKDLNYRLRTHRIFVPPLRERMEDVPLLFDHFLREAAAALNKTTPAVPDAIVELLQSYPFPGNVRELQSMVFDAVSRHTTGTLSLHTFRQHIRMHQERGEGGGVQREAAFTEAGAAGSLIFPERLPTIKEATRLLVEEALRRAGGNQSAAAQVLGITQQALSKRMKKQKQK